jgi:hypothetical protein
MARVQHAKRNADENQYEPLIQERFEPGLPVNAFLSGQVKHARS